MDSPFCPQGLRCWQEADHLAFCANKDHVCGLYRQRQTELRKGAYVAGSGMTGDALGIRATPLARDSRADGLDHALKILNRHSIQNRISFRRIFAALPWRDFRLPDVLQTITQPPVAGAAVTDVPVERRNCAREVVLLPSPKIESMIIERLSRRSSSATRRGQRVLAVPDSPRANPILR